MDNCLHCGLCQLLRVSGETQNASEAGHVLTYNRTCASSIYTATYQQMESEFGDSRIVSVLGLSMFVLGIACGPMFFSPLSEFYGRRPIYLVAWTVYVIWSIPQAVAKNVTTIIVCRFLDGFSGSTFLTVSGGTVGDLFTPNELQVPMAIFTLAPFLGPCAGPLLGGFINYNANWRWTYYVLLIWNVGLLVAIILFVPETYRKIFLCWGRTNECSRVWKADRENLQIQSSSVTRQGSSARRREMNGGWHPPRRSKSRSPRPSAAPYCGRSSCSFSSQCACACASLGPFSSVFCTSSSGPSRSSLEQTTRSTCGRSA